MSKSLKEELKQNNTVLLYMTYMIMPEQKNPCQPSDLKVKIARYDLSQNFMDTAKTMDLTCSCLQINNYTVVFFQSNL